MVAFLESFYVTVKIKIVKKRTILDDTMKSRMIIALL